MARFLIGEFGLRRVEVQVVLGFKASIKMSERLRAKLAIGRHRDWRHQNVYECRDD